MSHVSASLPLPDPHDHEFEPIPGLPAHLPEGERILWQGRPVWTRLAIHAFHVRKVAIYFAALLAWVVASAIADGDTLAETAKTAAMVTAGGSVAVGILTALGFFSAKATVYTITDRRIVLRIGIALPLVITVPFNLVAIARFRPQRKGIGDIPVALISGERIGYGILWPHARPWTLLRPQPMLRCVPEGAAVATVLASALRADMARRKAGEEAETEMAPHAQAAE